MELSWARRGAATPGWHSHHLDAPVTGEGAHGKDEDMNDSASDPWDEADDDPWADYDHALLRRVAEGLVTTVAVRGREVEVMVQNGVVILEGTVATAEVKEAAGRRVWATPGVHDVCNMLVPDPR